MSRDIYVQDIPAEAGNVEAIPDDWEPGSLPFGALRVREAVLAIAPEADFSDPNWGHVSLPGVDIEVSLSDQEPLDSFALHVRGSDEPANLFVGALLDRLGVRAFDPEGAPESGIFGCG